MESFVVLAIACLIAGWFVCGLVIAFLVMGMREMGATLSTQRATFISFGTLLFAPSVAPAGTLAAIPLPFGIMLLFVRSFHDLGYFIHLWWFLLPSFLVTGIACWLLSRLIVP
jgi:hypothetical protein